MTGSCIIAYLLSETAIGNVNLYDIILDWSFIGERFLNLDTDTDRDELYQSKFETVAVSIY